MSKNTWPGHCECDEVLPRSVYAVKNSSQLVMTYTRSRHPFTKREVVYCKTPATESPISAKVSFCDVHTASSPHVHSPRPGQEYQCRTKSVAEPSYPTLPQANFYCLPTKYSKVTFDGISHLRGLLSQVSLDGHVLTHLKVSTLIEHATAQTVVLRILTPIIRIFPDYDDFPAEGGRLLPGSRASFRVSSRRFCDRTRDRKSVV